MKLEYWAPKIIGLIDNPNHFKIEKKLIKHCLNLSKKINKGGENWVSKNTYNTLETFNLHTDKKFDELNNWIYIQISEFAKILNYETKYKCNHSWFNIYNKNDYQEYHTHSYNTLSAVYFLKSNPKRSSKIVFKVSKDPTQSDPIIRSHNPLISDTAFYESVPGRLLIFKSNLPHCVEKSEENETRISLAYNFINNT